MVEERDSLQRKLEDNQMELAKLQVSEPSPFMNTHAKLHPLLLFILRNFHEKYVQVVEERDSLQRKLEDNQMELAKLQVSEPASS